MDNPTRWNITNSAQNIVSALVDPSKQYDNVFRREWTNTFAGFGKHKPPGSTKTKSDSELKDKLKVYLSKLDNRRNLKTTELLQNGSSSHSSEFTGNIVVPEIFLREDFDLSNLDTFATVMSIGKVEYKIDDLQKQQQQHDHDISEEFIDDYNQHKRVLFTKNQLKDVQQRLTDYLDVIEEHLASQISSRSGDFFQVMSSVDSVMDELSLAIKSVTQLRRKCTKLNENVMLPNMKSIHLNKIRDNARSVMDKLNEISYLCKVQPMVQILLSASDFVGALDLISKSRIKLHKDLTRVVSLRYMESQLNEIERMIGTMMQQEFLTLISSEWDGSFNQQAAAASRLSKLFDYFANGYSEIPDRGQLTLLSLLQIQAEKFVNQFHEERKKRVESALDIEQWKVVEVPRDFQSLISMMIDEKVNISELFTRESLQHLTQDSSLSKSPSSVSISSSLINNNTQDGPGSTKLTTNTSNDLLASGKFSSDLSTISRKDKLQGACNNYVRVAGSEFVVVNSVINLVRTVMDYCKCAHGIKSLSADLLERLFKILHLYNSKTYHLVYSAGAIHAAGLRAITTRSLIVSQRSLKLIILIIPAIQQHFSQLLPNDKRLRRFNEIRSLYEEHVAKIPERVKSIVKDIINLQLHEWEAKPPVPSSQFNSVAQHFIRLHDNIQDTLPDDELVCLFKELSDTFIEVLVKHLRRLNITNDAGPQQWLVMQELTFYRISLSKLKAFQGIELNFDNLWSSLDLQISQAQDEHGDSNGTVSNSLE
uniref:Vacuolar protein sorting-associated protein 54 n=1 Tax=Aceria tosichella TaxID=561515 RepID=A0A6G1S728_9ACAR